jgi:hypothetical protein
MKNFLPKGFLDLLLLNGFSYDIRERRKLNTYA